LRQRVSRESIWSGRGVIRHWAEQLVPIIGGLEPETVGANFVDRLVRAAVSAGARRPQILAALGFTNAELRNPVGRLPGTALVDLFSVIEREFADPAAPLKLAGGARPGCFSDLGYVAMFAPTIGEMISATVNIQLFRQNVWHTQFDHQSRPVRLNWHFPNACAATYSQVIEFSVASYVHLYRNSIPARPTPVAIHFQHAPRFAIEQISELLGCPVSFGAASTFIEFDPDQLNIPSPNANPVLQKEVLARYTQAIKWLREGRKHSAFGYLYLASELNKSTLRLDRLAASSGISERTLRRRLVEEGHPFRELLEKVRRDMYDLYRMENRRSMSQIAELLGYAELSAFTRAHKQWYGKPPTG
jgi:AraC-like DNA-binding protein